MIRDHGRLLAGLLASAVVVLAGCGVPVDGAPRSVDPTRVPNNLLDRTVPTTRSEPATPSGKAAVSYFVDDDHVVAVPRPEFDGNRRAKLRHAIDDLLDGPTDAEQATGLSTVIPADLGMTVTGIDAHTAAIDLTGTFRNSPTSDLTLAVAQIVLTLTAVPGVERVALTQKGKTVEAPLIDGSLTADPLSPDDYFALLRPVPSSTATPTN